jgi:Ni,Fe-hydrogenase I cytochrome b subunit
MLENPVFLFSEQYEETYQPAFRVGLMGRVELIEKMFFEKGFSSYRETYRQEFWAFRKRIVEWIE